jgi:hypothetical protein
MPERPELTLEKARDLILAAPAPVLMGDTCGLLDVARSPLRPKSGGLIPAAEVVDAAERQPKELHVVVPALVAEEWDRHYAATCKELRDHIDKTRTAVTALRAACEAFRIPPPDEISSGVELLKDVLPDLALRLFNSAIVLASDKACRREASVRSRLDEPPARPGGSAADCIIIEHCLGLATLLEVSGFALPRVFVSSNTKDYCERGSLRPKLVRDFKPVGLQFASNLAAARAKLWPKLS